MSIISGQGKYGFDAYGEKVLRAEHMALWMNVPKRVDPKGISFELGASIAEVEDGFFLLLPTIKELYILNPACKVRMALFASYSPESSTSSSKERRLSLMAASSSLASTSISSRESSSSMPISQSVSTSSNFATSALYLSTLIFTALSS